MRKNHVKDVKACYRVGLATVIPLYIPCNLARRDFSGSLAITYLSSAILGAMQVIIVNKRNVSLAIDMLVLVLRTELVVIHCIVHLGFR